MNWKVFLRRTAPRLLAAVLLVAIVVVVITGLLHGRAGLFTDLEGKLREPFQEGAHTVAGWLESLYGSVYRYDQLQAENETLRNQLADAQAEARAAQEAVEENERLRQLLAESDTRDFVERVARRDYGYCWYGETIYEVANLPEKTAGQTFQVYGQN